jgi:hypothetical protein
MNPNLNWSQQQVFRIPLRGPKLPPPHEIKAAAAAADITPSRDLNRSQPKTAFKIPSLGRELTSPEEIKAAAVDTTTTILVKMYKLSIR